MRKDGTLRFGDFVSAILHLSVAFSKFIRCLILTVNKITIGEAINIGTNNQLAFLQPHGTVVTWVYYVTGDSERTLRHCLQPNYLKHNIMPK